MVTFYNPSERLTCTKPVAYVKALASHPDPKQGSGEMQNNSVVPTAEKCGRQSDSRQ